MEYDAEFINQLYAFEDACDIAAKKLVRFFVADTFSVNISSNHVNVKLITYSIDDKDIAIAYEDIFDIERFIKREGDYL